MNNLNNKIVSLKSEIHDVVERMLKEQIDLIEGCHKITSLNYQLNHPDDIFIFFKGIASETEDFAFDKVRNTCSLQHLAELDLEKEKYLLLIKKDILDACRKVRQITNE